MTREEKIKIAKWYIREWCFLGENQTIAKNTNDLEVLENIIKTDKSGFACDRCIHGQTELCNRICGYNNQFLKFHFQYVYWKNIPVKRNEWDKI